MPKKILKDESLKAKFEDLLKARDIRGKTPAEVAKEFTGSDKNFKEVVEHIRMEIRRFQKAVMSSNNALGLNKRLQLLQAQCPGVQCRL